jgi:hypothetical protein
MESFTVERITRVQGHCYWCLHSVEEWEVRKIDPLEDDAIIRLCSRCLGGRVFAQLGTARRRMS